MVTDQTYRRRVTNLASAIIQRANASWRPYGRYCLLIRGMPPIPKPTSLDGKGLILSAIKFLDKTEGTEKQVSEELMHCEVGSIVIQNKYQKYDRRKIVVLFLDEENSNAPVV